MPGTLSGKSFLSDVPRAGGGGFSGGQTDPFAYALSEEALGYKRAEEQRAQKSSELATKREEFEQKAAERRLQREDDLSSALDFIDTKLGNPASMHFQDKYEEVMGDPIVHRAMASREGRQSVMGMLKYQHDSHQDYLDGWRQIASNYGYEGDVSKLPTNKNGEVDWQKTLPIFNDALSRKQQIQAMQKVRGQEEAFRMGAIPSEITPEGEVKGYKMVKGQKPKLIPLTSLSQEEQLAALIPLKSQIDPNLPIEKQKRLLMDLAKKSGYQF
jgi:hypothetical protein